jgi:hypothetical protein
MIYHHSITPGLTLVVRSNFVPFLPFMNAFVEILQATRALLGSLHHDDSHRSQEASHRHALRGSHAVKNQLVCRVSVYSVDKGQGPGGEVLRAVAVHEGKCISISID